MSEGEDQWPSQKLTSLPSSHQKVNHPIHRTVSEISQVPAVKEAKEGQEGITSGNQAKTEDLRSKANQKGLEEVLF